MKTARIISYLMSVLIGIFLTLPAHADSNRDSHPIQIQLLGSNLGSGGSLGYHAGEMFYLGIESFSTKGEQETENSNPSEADKVEWDLSSIQAIIRFSPFSESGFFVQAGSVVRNWVFTGTWIDYDGSGGGTDNAVLEITFPTSGANVGMGGNWIWESGFSLGVGLSLITGGAPTVEIKESGLTSAQEEEAEKDLNEDAEKYKTTGQVYAIIGFNF